MTWLNNNREEIAVPLLAVFTAMLIGMVLVGLIGYDPFYVYGQFIAGAVGGPVEFGQTLIKSAPLILTGLSVAIAFRAGLFNIGGNGQAIVGLLAGGIIAIHFSALPSVIHVPLVIIAAAAMGGAWGAFAGFLNVVRGANEVVTTIMLNYIGVRLGEYLLRQNGGPLQDGSNVPQSDQYSDTSRFGVIWAPDNFTSVRIDIILALSMAFMLWYILQKTTLGFQIRAVGLNKDAAEYGGMSVAKVTVIAMFLAGAFAGMAGAAVSQTPDVARMQYGEMAVLSVGFSGIAVALLGRNAPLGVVLAGLLFGAMDAGANGIQTAIQAADAAAGATSASGIGGKLVQIIQGLIVLFVGADVIFRMLIRRVLPERIPDEPAAEGGAT